ncbi:MAG: hypothetical protein JXR94_20150 [Candidatus Hydrogenedentes bacterium]|nr:hypothetical protein [Candidatus Hydrogenedentota bacterium]
MIAWQKQETAYVGKVQLADGHWCKVVLVGARTNPQGAMVVVAGKGGEAVKPRPFADCVAAFTPDTVMEVYCTQERAFGDRGLEPPDLP